MKGYFRYTVTGKGEFPVDMLRRNRCYPTDTMSACNMFSTETKKRSVALESDESPKIKYWNSYQWKVKIEWAESKADMPYIVRDKKTIDGRIYIKNVIILF